VCLRRSFAPVIQCICTMVGLDARNALYMVYCMADHMSAAPLHASICLPACAKSPVSGECDPLWTAGFTPPGVLEQSERMHAVGACVLDAVNNGCSKWLGSWVCLLVTGHACCWCSCSCSGSADPDICMKAVECAGMMHGGFAALKVGNSVNSKFGC